MKQNDDHLAILAVIDPVARTHIDLELKNAFSHRLGIAKKTSPNANKPNSHDLLQRGIQGIQPLLERALLRNRLVVSNLDRGNIHAITSLL